MNYGIIRSNGLGDRLPGRVVSAFSVCLRQVDSRDVNGRWIFGLRQLDPRPVSGKELIGGPSAAGDQPARQGFQKQKHNKPKQGRKTT